MFLHFSDWSSNLGELEKKGIPHGGKIIKVFASREDPRLVLGRPEITTIQAESAPFTGRERFTYPGRRTFRGHRLEEDLAKQGYCEEAKEHIRALFRFANSQEVQACQYAMSVRNSRGRWVFKHPFNDLDGLRTALIAPRRSASIHLDLFSERTLVNLWKTLDLRDEGRMVTKTEVVLLTRRIQSPTDELKSIRPEVR